MGFDFDIRYRLDKQNVVADALSRRHGESEICALTGPAWAIWDQIREATAADLEVLAIRQDMEKNDQEIDDYERRDQLLFLKGRVWVPAAGNLRGHLLQHFHDSIQGYIRLGHDSPPPLFGQERKGLFATMYKVVIFVRKPKLIQEDPAAYCNHCQYQK